jgi:hypothetical protein
VLCYSDMVSKDIEPYQKTSLAYRLCANAPVAQLDRVRGYEPLIPFLSLPHDSAVS